MAREKEIFDELEVLNSVDGGPGPTLVPKVVSIAIAGDRIWTGDPQLADRWGFNETFHLRQRETRDLRIASTADLLQLKRNLSIAAMPGDSGHVRFLV